MIRRGAAVSSPRMAKPRALATLVAAAGPPTSRAPRRLREAPITVGRGRLLELEALLHLRDGFRALSGALVVRPSVTVAAVRGVDEWNEITLWRAPYRGAAKLYFFAEDIIGRQFALHKDEVHSFDPETGTFESWASDLEGWAARILEDPDDLGESRLVEWQADHGPLGPSQRLMPSIPFMFAEATDVQWRVIEDVELMKRYARLFRETMNAPEGTQIALDWW
jgi:hypothetical protein